MFQIQNLPIAIEPGVAAVEVELLSNQTRPETVGKTITQRKRPLCYVKLGRLDLAHANVADLPFVTSVKFPHIFSLAENVAESLLLVLYDATGRLSVIYFREHFKDAWTQRQVTAEHAGHTIKQSSVRFVFAAERSLERFMTLTEKIVTTLQQSQNPDPADMREAFLLLAKMRCDPVVLPLNVARCERKPIKLL